MPKIIVASTNPVKAQAVQDGFELVFPDLNFQVETIDVPSGVADQPASDAETLAGAQQRALNAAAARPGFDFYAGIEGGVENSPAGGMRAFAWVVIYGDGLLGTARSGAFELPPQIADLVRQGVELGEADDRVFGRTDSKRKDGAIGILTGGAVDRQALYAQAVALALVRYKHPELYPPEGPAQAQIEK
jgi:inosine/xanthosine triphosphatase